jgi:putative ABC transport system permease protein
LANSRSKLRSLFLSALRCHKPIVDLIARFHSNESFQIPAVIEARTYLAAALVVAVAAAASAFAVNRAVGRLDLVAVLKTRD